MCQCIFSEGYDKKIIDWVWGQHMICWTWRQKCCPQNHMLPSYPVNNCIVSTPTHYCMNLLISTITLYFFNIFPVYFILYNINKIASISEGPYMLGQIQGLSAKQNDIPTWKIHCTLKITCLNSFWKSFLISLKIYTVELMITWISKHLVILRLVV